MNAKEVQITQNKLAGAKQWNRKEKEQRENS